MGRKAVWLNVLTKREIEIIRHIATGARNKEIADKLFIAECTVKNHITHIFNKLDINYRSQLVAYAYKNNIATRAG